VIRIARTLPRSVSFAGRVRRFLETRAGILIPELSVFVPKHRNILAILRTPTGVELYPASNIVTAAGADWYAAKSTGAAPANDFTSLVLGTGRTVAWAAGSLYSNLTGVVAGSTKVAAGGYPQASDPDADNADAGSDVVSWLFNYAKADFNTATPITDGVITIAAPVAGSPLLTGFSFVSSFTKSVDDTLKVFANHQFVGS
jgi:hypothetical protein